MRRQSRSGLGTVSVSLYPCPALFAPDKTIAHLEVLADGGEVRDYIDAVLLKLLTGPDAAELQQLW